MSRLTWDAREYEIGVDRGVFYPANGMPEVWNGLVSVSETPTEISHRVRYIDGRKLSNHRRDDSYSATIQAFSHPSSFLLNPRIPFGFSYRNQTATGHKIHLVYNALAYISGRTHNQSDDVEPISFEISTLPRAVPDVSPSAHLVIDTVLTSPVALTELEAVLYGDESVDGRLPSPDELFAIFEANALYKVIDNGDGTFTLDAPDDAIEEIMATLFEVEWPRITYLNETTYRMRSW